MNDITVLTAPVIGSEFTQQLRARLGQGTPPASAMLLEKPDAFGPVRVIEVKWGKFSANLQSGLTALRLPLHDYSRLFVQPQVEAWIAEQQRMP
jgi:hypothetical protein